IILILSLRCRYHLVCLSHSIMIHLTATGNEQATLVPSTGKACMTSVLGTGPSLQKILTTCYGSTAGPMCGTGCSLHWTGGKSCKHQHPLQGYPRAQFC